MKSVAELIGSVVILVGTVLFWLLIIVAVSVLTGWAISIVWNWTIPDLFKGLVEKNLLPGTINWIQGFKLSLLLGLLGLTARSSSSSSSSKKK